jgi:RNA polymerase-interacting CarD/CdnL/TRCF family regulator
MTEPLTAGLLVTLAVQEFVKSGTGDLAKRFTAEALDKIHVLWEKIKTRLMGRSEKVNEALAKVESGDSTAIATLTKNLDVILDEDSLFAEELQILGRAIQAGEITQVGLRDVTAGRIEAGIKQKAKGDLVEQIGAQQIKADGDAIFTIEQEAN